MAGEVGHMVVKPEGLPCGCGGRGCLEVYASATGMRRMALEAIERGEGKGNLEKSRGEGGRRYLKVPLPAAGMKVMGANTGVINAPLALLETFSNGVNESSR